MQADWINIHTHKPGPGTNIADPVLGEVVLPGDGKVYYSLGIHPCYIGAGTEERLEAIARAAAVGEIVAVGEAGLDRNAETEMEVQQTWFVRQAEIASRFGLPMIIHGVRAIPELISVYKSLPSPGSWILHGFNNRREILQDLLRHGFYISAGRQVMNPESPVYRLLPEIPEERLFIETDNSDFGIEAIYEVVARRRGMSCEALQKVVRANFQRLFGEFL